MGYGARALELLHAYYQGKFTSLKEEEEEEEEKETKTQKSKAEKKEKTEEKEKASELLSEELAPRSELPPLMQVCVGSKYFTRYCRTPLCCLDSRLKIGHLKRCITWVCRLVSHWSFTGFGRKLATFLSMCGIPRTT